MKRTIDLHREAMHLAERADEAKREGDKQRAVELLHAAFEREREAAHLVQIEPSRSVLLRSAASLALEYGNTREAERCVARALEGNPPVEIADELRDLLEQIYFTRHLDLRGVELGTDEFQMSLAGKDVGFGMAKSDRFAKRIESIQKLVRRTAARKAKKPFNESAGGKEAYDVYVTVPRAASLAVSFRVALPQETEQGDMFDPTVTPEVVVAEVLGCLALLNEGKEPELRQRIEDEAYYLNFVGIAKQIAPDGEAINLVGFTSSPAEGAETRLEFRRKSGSINAANELPQHKPLTTVQYRGRLAYADNRPRRLPTIQIINAEGRQQPIRVPPGMMADVVRPQWDYDVVVTCVIDEAARPPLLKDIQRLSEADK